MKAEEHRPLAGTLLELVQHMEKILKDYGHLLTAHDDGHWLEQNDNEEA